MFKVGDIVRFKSHEQIIAENIVPLRSCRFRGRTIQIPQGDSTDMHFYYNDENRENNFFVITKIYQYDTDYVVNLTCGKNADVVSDANGVNEVESWMWRWQTLELAPEGTPMPEGIIPVGSLITLKCTSNVPSAYRGKSFTTSSICHYKGMAEYFDRFALGARAFRYVDENGEVAEILHINANTGITFTAAQIKSIDSGYTGDPVFLPCIKNCCRCSDSFSIDENETMSSEDAELCPSCRQRKYVTPYHHYAPAFTFAKTETDSPDTKLFYGVELEVDEGGESHDEAARIVNLFNPKSNDADKPWKHDWLMYCSHDGSLSRGIEMITAPMTLAKHHEMAPKYTELFNMLKRDSYRSHNTSTCGMHIHFSRDYFRDEKGNDEVAVCKLLYLVNRFWDDFVVFSRRDYSSLARYAKKSDSTPTRFYQMWNRTGIHDGHYYAVNIANANTIELRMFRGTLNIDTFMATLDFVDAVVRIAKEKSMDELSRLQFAEILPPAAKAYYETRIGQMKFCGLQD